MPISFSSRVGLVVLVLGEEICDDTPECTFLVFGIPDVQDAFRFLQLLWQLEGG